MTIKYELRARTIPACVSIMPVLVFYYFFLRSPLGDFVGFINNYFKVAGDLSVALISIFVFSQFDRSISKFFYEKNYFKNKNNFPTTNFLLYSDKKYSRGYKDKIRERILDDFQIKLLSANQEENDLGLAKQKITEAVGLIIDKIKDGRLVLQHNIEYGFYRNFIGGSTIALAITILNAIFFCFIYFDMLALIFSVALIFVYLIPIVFSKKIMVTHGQLYADILFKEYLSKN